MATRLYELLPFFYFVQLSFGQISFMGPAETLETLPTSLGGLQVLTIIDINLLPLTLHQENYTSTWTLPNGEMVSMENQSPNTNILVIQGRISINATTNGPSTSLLVQGLSYTDAGVYRCSVQDDRNPGSPPIEATIELRLTLTLTAINSSVTVMDNASFAELRCDMSDYIRSDEQLQWFRDGEMITSGQARRHITFINGNANQGQFGGLSTQSSRVSMLTISNPVSSDTGVYNCHVIGTTENVDIELLIQSSAMPILSIALGGTIGGLLLLISLLIVVIIVCVVKTKSLKQKQQNNHTDDPMYDYPDELPQHPLPQPRTNDHEIQMTTDNDSPDHNYETTMNTTNPAYGLTLSASAGISVYTNIAYGMVNDIPITATNSAQQQDETPPATNPTFEDGMQYDHELANCPSVAHPSYKQEVYDPSC
ncbi:uncharacterized protein LOC135343301 isoform X1 [Halichondria panicea]|uniref:uncharacterized protein LOC135343301 isoform X1 n=1 Tax=Halichondria panicea TaxID=6063 RepID=UPI00312BC19C